MSNDNGLTTDNAPAAPAAAAPTPEPAPASAAPADPLAEPPSDRAVFDRGYVESVRREAQRYRSEAQEARAGLDEYNRVFSGYEPDDRQVWLDLAATWAQDPNRAAQVMQVIAANVLGSGEQKLPADADAEQVIDAAEEMFGKDQVQKMIDDALSEREVRVSEQRQVDAVFDEIRGAGLEPSSADGMWVLHTAANVTGGDVAQALQMLQEHRQAIIDDYVQGRSSGRVALPSSSDGVQATSAPEPIVNLDDAKRATDAFLKERMANRGG